MKKPWPLRRDANLGMKSSLQITSNERAILFKVSVTLRGRTEIE
jgi:hypothetical protein